jgi:hypothetical protein
VADQTLARTGQAGGVADRRTYAQADGFPVYVIESPARSGPSLYLSAGIHGDEADGDRGD